MARHEDGADSCRFLRLTVLLRVVQLTPLRPAADQFHALLNTALTAELSTGKMKTEAILQDVLIGKHRLGLGLFTRR